MNPVTHHCADGGSRLFGYCLDGYFGQEYKVVRVITKPIYFILSQLGLLAKSRTMDAPAKVALGSRPCKRRREDPEVDDSKLANERQTPKEKMSTLTRIKVKSFRDVNFYKTLIGHRQHLVA